jgi:ABC-type amino acid transport system permease subunit
MSVSENRPGLPETVEISTGDRVEASIVWLHGLGADGHDFEPVVPELRPSLPVATRFVFPHAPVRPVTVNGGYAMRAWYDILSFERGALQDSAGIHQSHRMVDALIEREVARGVPRQRIVLAGFSQGGAMALYSGVRQPEALAGILALTLASVGFIGKLFTEAIEEISEKQVEAVRATGSPFASVLAFGVLPQVFSRFIGFATYQLDSNLRNSTMVGIVGAGGIGGTLFAAFQRFDYDYVCAILISIIALIMLGEVLATAVRAIFIDNATLSDLFRRRGTTAREMHLEDD